MRWFKVLTVVTLLCIFSVKCVGAGSWQSDARLRWCILRSAYKYGVHPGIVESIIAVESGFDPLAVNYNRDGSVDVGIMQINSYWFPRLKKYGIAVKDLFDPCVNVEVGTWILAQCFARYGYTWEAVGCYNAVSPVKRREYALKVYRTFRKIVKRNEVLR